MKEKKHIELKDMKATPKRLDVRELGDAELKLVTGGAECQGGTCSNTADCDE